MGENWGDNYGSLNKTLWYTIMYTQNRFCMQDLISYEILSEILLLKYVHCKFQLSVSSTFLSTSEVSFSSFHTSFDKIFMLIIALFFNQTCQQTYFEPIIFILKQKWQIFRSNVIYKRHHLHIYQYCIIMYTVKIESVLSHLKISRWSLDDCIRALCLPSIVP